jgi:hypothetical protein
MASVDSPVQSYFGGQYPVRKCVATLTVAASATSATFTSTSRFRGTIEKIEIDPGAAMTTSATLKGYEANTPLATGTRDHFLNYTFPASEVELVFYPVKPVTLNTGVAETGTYDGTHAIVDYTKYVVDDYLKIDLASATAGDATTVRIYVRG